MTELSEAERAQQDYEADRAVDDDRVQDSVERVKSTVMRRVVDHVSLHEALLGVQSQLPKIERGETAVVETKGGGSFSYKYVDLATVHEAVLPLLNMHGLVWLTMPDMIPQADGTFVFMLRWELRHEDGDKLDGCYPLAQGNPQQVGSQITYARRYCLLAVLGLAPEDDDGAAASQPSPVQAARQEQQVSRTPGQNEVARQAERRNIAPQDAINAFAELFGADWGSASEAQLFAFAEHLDKYGLSRGGES